MQNYDRSEPTGYREIDRWGDGVGWLAHPRERGRRASHAVRGYGGDGPTSSGDRQRSGDGVWLFDPLDAPGVDELIADLGAVAGVAVCSNWHARGAGALARRHDVAVHLPAWMTRVADRVDAPVERYEGSLGGSGFRIRACRPLPGWREAIAYREADGTLYVPESLGTAPAYTVGDERLGCSPIRRPAPPRRQLGDLEPERVLVGHGTGVFDDAADALADALGGARRRLPRAVVENGDTQLRALLEALAG